jgi:hypothetical protein
MTVVLLFPDGSEIIGTSATHVLTKLLSGWNPDTIGELRNTLASRAGIVHDVTKTDIEFLYQLDATGWVTVQQIVTD